MKRLLLSVFYDRYGLTIAGGMVAVLMVFAVAHGLWFVWTLCTS